MNTAIWMLSLAAAASALAESSDQGVTVYASSDAAVPTIVLRRAETVTGKLFAGINVPIRWREGRPHTGDSRSLTLAIRLEAEVPLGFRPGALAFANPEHGGVMIHVLYRRVAAYRSDLRYALLGYVMAHEIAHLLQGVSRHSEDGILKAQWTPRDYDAMSDGSLGFAPEDVMRIQRYVRAAAAERDSGIEHALGRRR